MLEEQHREGEKSDWVWLPHTANSILGTLVRVRGELIGGALGDSRKCCRLTEITVNHKHRLPLGYDPPRYSSPHLISNRVCSDSVGPGGRAPGRPAWRSNVVWVPTHRESLVPTILQGCRSETMVKTVRTARRRRTQ